MEPNPDVLFVVPLDDLDDPADVIEALALGRFAAGVEPAAHSRRLNHLHRSAPLLPPQVEAIWTAERAQSPLGAPDPGWTLLAVRWTDRSGELTVTAATDQLAREVLQAAAANAEEPAPDENETVTVGFWHQGRCGSLKNVERDIAVESWERIRNNYSSPAASALEAAMATGPRELPGAFSCSTDLPGTGKTTALRALAHALAIVVPVGGRARPGATLGDSAYLRELRGPRGRRRRESVASGRARGLRRVDSCRRQKGRGQSLARLLNLTDGIVGQGLTMLLAITTNKPIHQLHPAIVRPGRCTGRHRRRAPVPPRGARLAGPVRGSGCRAARPSPSCSRSGVDRGRSRPIQAAVGCRSYL